MNQRKHQQDDVKAALKPFLLVAHHQGATEGPESSADQIKRQPIDDFVGIAFISWHVANDQHPGAKQQQSQARINHTPAQIPRGVSRQRDSHCGAKGKVDDKEAFANFAVGLTNAAIEVSPS